MKPIEAHFQFLDDLRASGKTNMYGASPFLAEEFGLEDRDASSIVMAWMKTFDREKTPAERIALTSAEGKRK